MKFQIITLLHCSDFSSCMGRRTSDNSSIWCRVCRYWAAASSSDF